MLLGGLDLAGALLSVMKVRLLEDVTKFWRVDVDQATAKGVSQIMTGMGKAVI